MKRFTLLLVFLQVVFDFVEFILEFFTERIEFELAILILNDDFLLQKYFCDKVFILLGQKKVFLFQTSDFFVQFLIFFVDLDEFIFNDIV